MGKTETKILCPCAGILGLLSVESTLEYIWGVYINGLCIPQTHALFTPQYPSFSRLFMNGLRKQTLQHDRVDLGSILWFFLAI